MIIFEGGSHPRPETLQALQRAYEGAGVVLSRREGVLKGQAVRVPVLLFVALVAGAIGAPATAAPTCLLEVDSQRYLDGLCTVTEAGSGSWLIVRDRLSGQAATVKVNPILSGRGDAAWTGPSGDGRLSEALGPVRREGSCWVNARARICAWGFQ